MARNRLVVLDSSMFEEFTGNTISKTKVWKWKQKSQIWYWFTAHLDFYTCCFKESNEFIVSKAEGIVKALAKIPISTHAFCLLTKGTQMEQKSRPLANHLSWLSSFFPFFFSFPLLFGMRFVGSPGKNVFFTKRGIQHGVAVYHYTGANKHNNKKYILVVGCLVRVLNQLLTGHSGNDIRTCWRDSSFTVLSVCLCLVVRWIQVVPYTKLLSGPILKGAHEPDKGTGLGPVTRLGQRYLRARQRHMARGPVTPDKATGKHFGWPTCKPSPRPGVFKHWPRCLHICQPCYAHCRRCSHHCDLARACIRTGQGPGTSARRVLRDSRCLRGITLAWRV